MLMVLFSVFVVIIVIASMAICYYIRRPQVKSNILQKIETIEKINTKYCHSGTGEWNGENCTCKYPEVITNNTTNGNCDKILLKHCKALFDLDGNEIDYESSSDIFINGFTCDCGNEYIFDHGLKKCVLRRIINMTNLNKQRTDCGLGYIYSDKYKTCLKEFCSWDVLNPSVLTLQKVVRDNYCDCDFLNGFLSIKLSDTFSGCTKAILGGHQPLQEVHIFQLGANTVKHLFSQSLVGKRFKEYLFSNISESDDGTNMLAIQQDSSSWLHSIYAIGVEFFTTNSVKMIEPITFNQSFDQIIDLTDLSDIVNASVERFYPLRLEDLQDDTNIMYRPPAKDEVLGERRFLINKMFYSPIVLVDDKLTVNTAGVEAKLYDYVLLYYFPKKGIIIVETRKFINN